MDLFFNQGGTGDRLYVLIHGLGCTADVWRGVSNIIEGNAAGRWIAPDLRGHGRSEGDGVGPADPQLNRLKGTFAGVFKL